VNVAGEPLKRDLVNRIYELGAIERVFNLYGPTEDTTYSTFALITRDATGNPSIGRPIANTQVYILDSTLEPVALGVAGELYLGGAGLARGYLHRPDLTAERFIPDALGGAAGARLYRTGDVGRYSLSGEIEYLGRIDKQVKVRGYRIELGEIEAVLGEYASISEAAVVLREDAPDEKRLSAYFVAEQGHAVSIGELRAFLQERLPGYMIPSVFVELNALPLTLNGKLDRRALPVPAEARPTLESSYVLPRTPMEEILAAIWVDVLKLENVGVNDNFFELGGHSLLATKIVSRVRTIFQTELTLRTFMERPTVASVAEAVEASFREEQKTFAPPLVPVSREGEWPLSFAQQRLWFLDQLQFGNTLYNMHAALKLTGALDLPVFERSLSEIVRRHESLRTTFVAVDGQPTQVIHPAMPLSLPVTDLTEVAEAERNREAARLAAEEARQPFELRRGPLLRARLLRLDEDEHIILVTMHHIISDGWSMGIMVRELATLYRAFLKNAPSSLPELPIQYADFTHWQRNWLRGEVLERQLAYWRERLTDAPPLLELPTDRPRPALISYRGGYEMFSLDAELSRQLKTLSQRQGATLFMTMLTAFNILLWRWSGQTDISVGSPIANRTRQETEGLIGFFVNTLVLRSRIRGEATFTRMLEEVRENALGAYTHQELPFEKLVEELQPERNLSYTPLFQVMLVLQNAPQEKLSLPGLTISGFETQASLAKFDLTLNLRESADRLDAAFEYNTDLFDASTIRRMAGHLRTLLESIVVNPEQRLSELPILSDAERRQLLHEWNDTERDYPVNSCLHELFEAQVERTPERVAVVFENERLSYRELNRRANQLAHYLRSMGVGADSIVGICVERSIEMVVGILGIMKAGAAYVPLDTSYPRPRLSFMLEDSGVKVLLTQRHLEQLLPALDIRVVRLDADWRLIAEQDDENPTRAACPANLAYIIYTSGSTGRPKGVMISHRAICNHMQWMLSSFKLTEDDVVLQKTPFSFDASVWEFYAPLLVGARLVIARPAGHQDIDYQVNAIKEHSVTVVQMVPSLLKMLLEAKAGLEDCRSLRRVFCGGEALSVEVQDEFFRQADVELYNLYGPTEATIDATSWQCAPGQTSVHIGRPIANTQVYILDSTLEPVALGVAGELYLGGAGLARGYLHRPDLTAERFIPDALGGAAGARLYRTGDVGRYSLSGEIEYLGRIDKQVKVRGYRIELGEIEAVLNEHPAVREAVVVMLEEKRGEGRLAAYFVARKGLSLSVADLREHAKARLPEYMTPAFYKTLDELPRLPNGKVNRRALESLADDKFERPQTFIAPRETLELRLAQIWEEVLDVRPVGIKDNFFELGGHSLLAVRLIVQIQKKLGYDLPLVALFKVQTIEEIAMMLRQQSGVPLWTPLVAIQPHGARPPFFCVHPVGGNVFCYSALARHLGTDQPFYGLQTPGLDGVTQPYASIESLAAVYIEALRDVQPTGPYHLGGWSMGGLVAFEMAHQLRRQGRHVASLTLLDTQFPTAAKRGAQFDDEHLFLRFARDLERILGVDLALDKEHLPRGEPEEQLRYVLQQAAQSGCVPPDTELSQMHRLYQVFIANMKAMMSYAPQVYAGRMTLVRPLERASDAASKDRRQAWRKLAAEGIELHETPGNHYTMMKEPHVQRLAEYLRGALQRT
jgi:amino acid adenylation domain-containing protein